MNLKYEFFKQSIYQLIQKSNLEIGIIFYIFKDIYNDIEKLYYAQLNKESLAQAEEQKETTEEENE